MDTASLFPILVGVGVVAVFVLGALAFNSSQGDAAVQRLDELNRREREVSSDGSRRNDSAANDSILRSQAIDPDAPSFWSKLLPRMDAINRLYEQADVNLEFNKFMMIVVCLAGIGGAATVPLKLNPLMIPAGAAGVGGLPFLWLIHRKNKRIQDFVKTMPEAVELMGRALRAGHSLASGMNLVAEEMKGPIAYEFARVYHEQNLGIPIELSLRAMAERIPSMDVRFFVTAIIIQRATGGDLAEVLDKIGKLIRQRYELHGHVKALTAEGRLSGVVLLALPPALLGFLSTSNYNYMRVLFETPTGTKLLGITAVLQIIGAIAIKKIVAIKV